MTFHYLENFFDDQVNYFDIVTREHSLYDLRESTKETVSLRRGVYISNVTHIGDESYDFNLLRCSTNFKQGPTENFTQTDKQIIEKVNKVAQTLFDRPAELNHVLAQVYTNKVIDGVTTKAKIMKHSDKTKDMPENGLLAFCTFYDSKDLNKNYTTIRFRHKVTKEKIDFCLTHNSLFLIDLNTNAIYTHEIVPPSSCNNLPTRLGYVIRSSNVIATYTPNGTFINGVKMYRPSEQDVETIREFYLKENVLPEKFSYPKIYFSLNEGDYLKPLI